MKVLIQRVKSASVKVESNLVAQIDCGLLAFVGIEKDDIIDTVEKAVKKIVNLRIFPDNSGKMNKSILDTQGEMLIVSQFTLCGDCKKGTRPSFDNAAPPDKAKSLYEDFVKKIRSYGIKTGTGIFGAMMEVNLINDGPVTFMLEFS